MKKFLFITALLGCETVFAQTPVIDPANNGQLKRMVFIDWDDWQPDPGTGFLGIPKNPKGWFFWRVLHNQYYNGDDKRPYRLVGGPFMQNTNGVILQNSDEDKIHELADDALKTHIGTHVNMSGGVMDIAYATYFKRKFDGLGTEINEYIVKKLLPEQADLAVKITTEKLYMDYLIKKEILEDRIKTIHEGYMDKGDRIVSYLEIMKEYQSLNGWFIAVVNAYSFIDKFPTPEQIKAVTLDPQSKKTNAQIIAEILKKF